MPQPMQKPITRNVLRDVEDQMNSVFPDYPVTMERWAQTDYDMRVQAIEIAVRCSDANGELILLATRIYDFLRCTPVPPTE